LNILTSEVFYVGFNAAYERNLWEICHNMVLSARDKGIVVDSEILCSVMTVLSRNNRLTESWDLVNMINNNDFMGSDLSCDLNMYRLILGCAATNRNRDIMREVIKLVAAHTNKSSLRLYQRKKEHLFLLALQTCVFLADFPLALDIYITYLRSLDENSESIVIDMKAYSYLILSYLHYPGPKSKSTHPILDTIVSHMIRADVDKLPVIANLLLQLFSVRDDIPRAKSYLTRMKDTNIPISTNAWLAYNDMLARQSYQ